VHSVKGSAATIGLPTIVEIAMCRNVDRQAEGTASQPQRMQVDLLLQATDALAHQVRRASGAERAQTSEAEQSGALVERLSSASSALPSSPCRSGSEARAEAGRGPSLPRLDVAFSLAKSCQRPGRAP